MRRLGALFDFVWGWVERIERVIIGIWIYVSCYLWAFLATERTFPVARCLCDGVLAPGRRARIIGHG